MSNRSFFWTILPMLFVTITDLKLSSRIKYPSVGIELRTSNRPVLLFNEKPLDLTILPYHNFEGVPDNLDAMYQKMQCFKADTYKIAVTTPSTIDALKMLLWGKKQDKATVICMGEKGSFARVLGAVVGNLVDYACLDAPMAPGQLKVSEMMDIYNYPKLNADTAIYGLIGSPVDQSPGHIYHNAVFQKKNLNAVYVKMDVGPQELKCFIPLAKQLGMKGLSVTMPLKEKILPFVDVLDPIAEKIGAVNTLVFKNGKIYGINTDGCGALDAIENKMKVEGKKMVVVGAGGAARAIAFEAKLRGADVWIYNRTEKKAFHLAKEFGCNACKEIPNCEILINCTPSPIHVPTNTLYMDIRYGTNADITGEEMFLKQAARQTDFWL